MSTPTPATDSAPPYPDAEALIRGYFAACSGGDPATVAAHFTADAIVYDVNHRPVRGAAAIGEFYARVRSQWGGAVWEVNTFVGTGSGEGPAAIEWTMRGQQGGRDFAFRGSEHYALRGGCIHQIRQYWRFLPQELNTGLVDYPYAEDDCFAPQIVARRTGR